MEPTITFIVPVTRLQQFLMEQIDAIVKFSQNYDGLCEVMLPTDETGQTKLNIISMAIKIYKTKHPCIRIKPICFPQKTDLQTLINEGVKRAIGHKIFIILNMPEIDIENQKTISLFENERDIILAKYLLDVNMIERLTAD
mgnify:CR=1 FL=1